MTRKLIAGGLPPRTPAAVVQSAGLSGERWVFGRVSDIARRTRSARITSPAVTLIGDVVSYRARPKPAVLPLDGKTVLVTRARPQAGALSKTLSDLGARVIEFPTIRILPPKSWKPVDAAIAALDSFDWVIFTSVNGVEKFMERLKLKSRDARAFGRARVCAIGEATAARLGDYGLKADFVPPEYVSESLARTLRRRERLKNQKILLVRADIARDYLRKTLEKEGCRVLAVPGYRTVPASAGGARAIGRLKKGEIDYVTFTSSSTVSNFAKIVGKKRLAKMRGSVRWISIGPITSKTARSYGLKVHRQAKPHTIPGLVRALAGGNRHGLL